MSNRSFPPKALCVSRQHAKNKKDLRRLQMLQRIGLFGKDTTDATYERAVTVEDLRSAYSLVHDCFVDCGYIKPRPSGLRLRTFETSKDTATFIAKIQGKIVGVLSAVLDTVDLCLPSDRPYGEEMTKIRKRGGILAEFDNLAVQKEYRNTAVTTELMRCAFAHALHVGCNDVVCSVSSRIVPVFESMGFRQVGGERNYSESAAIDDPVVLLSLSKVQTRYRDKPYGVDALTDFWFEYGIRDNPHRARIDEWCRRSEALFQRPSEIASLFAACPELFDGCAPFELAMIKLRLGHAFENAAPPRALQTYRRYRKQKREYPVQTVSSISTSRLSRSRRSSESIPPRLRNPAAKRTVPDHNKQDTTLYREANRATRIEPGEPGKLDLAQNTRVQNTTRDLQKDLDRKGRLPTLT